MVRNQSWLAETADVFRIGRARRSRHETSRFILNLKSYIRQVIAIRPECLAIRAQSELCGSAGGFQTDISNRLSVFEGYRLQFAGRVRHLELSYESVFRRNGLDSNLAAVQQQPHLIAL